MIGIFIELILSWILLWFLERKDLRALGLLPDPQRLSQLALGIVYPIIYVSIFEFDVAALVYNPYRINPGYHLKDCWHAISYLFRTVGFEDLIFRGALLYILIRRLGNQKAILLSGIAFGIYHWFSWNAFGNPMQMLIVLWMTGSAGYVFALAFARTRSMYLGAGLHFGYDFASMVIFSQAKNIGVQWLTKMYASDPVSPGMLVSVLVLIIHFIGFPVLTWWLIEKWFPKDSHITS